MSNSFSIPFARPSLEEEELLAVNEVLSGHILTHGPKCKEFEKKFANYIGVKHAISTSSCTTALHLALASYGVSNGDEVILPAQTHVATAHVVEYCGAKPVFVDVSKVTGNIESHSIEQAINKKTKAILIVHYVGTPCEINNIKKISEKYKIGLIEDCAISLGATIKNEKTGSFGLAGCFSFYPSKHMTTMEGGMLVTNNDEFASLVRSKRAFGYDQTLDNRKVPGVYDIAMLGYNYRMSEAQAAIGIRQLEKLPSFINKRINNSDSILSSLSKLDDLYIIPFDYEQNISSRYCLNVVLPKDRKINRNEFILKLNNVGIGTSVHYPITLPLSLYYSKKYNYKSNDFPYSENLSSNTISLPCGPHLSEEEAEKIGKIFIDIYKNLN
ncbi:DegT/DnrJ/EryC1/StrS aminotransferase family protein [Alphaproteobacteria bacterium]|nr:DegT/DnrJ/EryC1/StrS aminotransferase family protein [Alphaproteobacteria bacterium]